VWYACVCVCDYMCVSCVSVCVSSRAHETSRYCGGRWCHHALLVSYI